jgi:hypothetical protein
MTPSPTVGPIITPPPQAVSAGYTRLAFDEEFNDTSGIDLNNTGAPGYNFYTRAPFGFPTLPASAIVVANGAVTINPTQNWQNLWTINGVDSPWRGFAATGGAYFEASIKFDPDWGRVHGNNGWPSFWTTAAEHMYGGLGTNYFETDFFEFLPDFWPSAQNQYAQTLYQWDNNQYDSWHNDWGKVVVNTPTPASHWLNSWNIIGCLWVTGSSGYIDGYFNNQLTTARNAYSDHPEFFDIANTQHWPIIIGTAPGWPLSIDYVRVWQKP